MPSKAPLNAATLLHAAQALAAQGHVWVSSAQLSQASGASLAAVKRLLPELLAGGRLQVRGKARATRYRLLPAAPGPFRGVAETTPGTGDSLRQYLSQPLAMRAPVGYRRAFVDDYVPNQSSLLPPHLAEELARSGHLPEQLPAGTYARKVLEQLLIDLSWSSSHLEGNRYSLLDTEKLFKSGAPATDSDSVMLLNHKAAIEFLVEAVPRQGLVMGLVRNLHAVLMQDLLFDVASLGAIREQVVNIGGSVYVPTQVPALLHEMAELILEKARQVKNPVEAAFFLWVNLAYLQPFEDGNKRVSRLAANVPLMLYNQAPLSFLEVSREDYALAMLGVYERRDVSLAVELFAGAYRRSQARYQVVLEAMGSPDAFRVGHREALSLAIGRVIGEGMGAAQASSGLGVQDMPRFRQLLDSELDLITVFNCARYRLLAHSVQRWLDSGRPR